MDTHTTNRENRATRGLVGASSKAMAMLIALAFFMFPAELPASTSEAIVDPTMPRVFFVDSLDTDKPVWVSLGAMFLPLGEIDRSYFEPYQLRRLHKYFTLPMQEGEVCVRDAGVISDYLNPAPRDTLRQTLDGSKWILRAKVTGKATGFQSLEAGTLLRLEVIEFLKGGAGERQIEYYVFFPVAEFEIGGKRFCKSDSTFPSMPALDDEVLLFISTYPGDSPELLTLLDGRDIAILQKNGKAEVSPAFSEEAPLSVDELLAASRAAVGGGDK